MQHVSSVSPTSAANVTFMPAFVQEKKLCSGLQSFVEKLEQGGPLNLTEQKLYLYLNTTLEICTEETRLSTKSMALYGEQGLAFLYDPRNFQESCDEWGINHLDNYVEVHVLPDVNTPEVTKNGVIVAGSITEALLIVVDDRNPGDICAAHIDGRNAKIIRQLKQDPYNEFETRYKQLKQQTKNWEDEKPKFDLRQDAISPACATLFEAADYTVDRLVQKSVATKAYHYSSATIDGALRRFCDLAGMTNLPVWSTLVESVSPLAQGLVSLLLFDQSRRLLPNGNREAWQSLKEKLERLIVPAMAGTLFQIHSDDARDDALLAVFQKWGVNGLVTLGQSLMDSLLQLPQAYLWITDALNINRPACIVSVWDTVHKHIDAQCPSYLPSILGVLSVAYLAHNIARNRSPTAPRSLSIAAIPGLISAIIDAYDQTSAELQSALESAQDPHNPYGWSREPRRAFFKTKEGRELYAKTNQESINTRTLEAQLKDRKENFVVSRFKENSAFRTSGRAPDNLPRVPAFSTRFSNQTDRQPRSAPITIMQQLVDDDAAGTSEKYGSFGIPGASAHSIMRVISAAEKVGSLTASIANITLLAEDADAKKPIVNGTNAVLRREVKPDKGVAVQAAVQYTFPLKSEVYQILDRRVRDALLFVEADYIVNNPDPETNIVAVSVENAGAIPERYMEDYRLVYENRANTDLNEVIDHARKRAGLSKESGDQGWEVPDFATSIVEDLLAGTIKLREMGLTGALMDVLPLVFSATPPMHAKVEAGLKDRLVNVLEARIDQYDFSGFAEEVFLAAHKKVLNMISRKMAHYVSWYDAMRNGVTGEAPFLSEKSTYDLWYTDKGQREVLKALEQASFKRIDRIISSCLEILKPGAQLVKKSDVDVAGIKYNDSVQAVVAYFKHCDFKALMDAFIAEELNKIPNLKGKKPDDTIIARASSIGSIHGAPYRFSFREVGMGAVFKKKAELGLGVLQFDGPEPFGADRLQRYPELAALPGKLEKYMGEQAQRIKTDPRLKHILSEYQDLSIRTTLEAIKQALAGTTLEKVKKQFHVYQPAVDNFINAHEPPLLLALGEHSLSNVVAFKGTDGTYLAASIQKADAIILPPDYNESEWPLATKQWLQEHLPAEKQNAMFVDVAFSRLPVMRLDGFAVFVSSVTPPIRFQRDIHYRDRLCERFASKMKSDADTFIKTGTENDLRSMVNFMTYFSAAIAILSPLTAMGRLIPLVMGTAANTAAEIADFYNANSRDEKTAAFWGVVASLLVGIAGERIGVTQLLKVPLRAGVVHALRERLMKQLAMESVRDGTKGIKKLVLAEVSLNLKNTAYRKEENSLNDGISGHIYKLDEAHVIKDYKRTTRTHNAPEHQKYAAQPQVKTLAQADMLVNANRNAVGLNRLYGPDFATVIVRQEELIYSKFVSVKMNVVPGNSLSWLLKNRDMKNLAAMLYSFNPLAIDRVIEDVLKDLKKNGVQHNDINAANVIYDGKEIKFRLIDFDNAEINSLGEELSDTQVDVMRLTLHAKVAQFKRDVDALGKAKRASDKNRMILASEENNSRKVENILAAMNNVSVKASDASWDYVINLLLDKKYITDVLGGHVKRVAHRASKGGILPEVLLDSSKKIENMNELVRVEPGKLLAFWNERNQLFHVMISVGKGKFAGIKNDALNEKFGSDKQVLVAEEFGGFDAAGVLRMHSANAPPLTVYAGDTESLTALISLPLEIVNRTTSLFGLDSHFSIDAEKAHLFLKAHGSPFNLNDMNGEEVSHAIRALAYRENIDLDLITRVTINSSFSGFGGDLSIAQTIASLMNVKVKAAPFETSNHGVSNRLMWFKEFHPQKNVEMAAMVKRSQALRVASEKILSIRSRLREASLPAKVSQKADALENFVYDFVRLTEARGKGNTGNYKVLEIARKYDLTDVEMMALQGSVDNIAGRLHDFEEWLLHFMDQIYSVKKLQMTFEALAGFNV
ncbi:hypothetical protein [Glaciimonas sp. PAMC28666]|uniref:hypothetical protein n=1 Tax=Glaciimonas sp. PAMC28666 TaxID=2807626 RepID=UPI001964C3BD|nr:hypothetical protein [Glaciimonas sp. PAMC28666]QRX82758.1 hypothetical protein JQN73_00045 [Glaciimonas sp. PAMC28666]